MHSEASWAQTQLKKEKDAIAKGEKSGRYEKVVEMAQKAIKKGYPIEDIVDISGLTEAEILLLKAQAEK